MDWKLTKLETERDYEISGVDDLQDASSTRRMVIRPRKVTVKQVYGSMLVRGAVIEGRQVRRDGELAGSKMILVGREETRWGYRTEPPAWLDEILAAEGLEWTRNGER